MALAALVARIVPSLPQRAIEDPATEERLKKECPKDWWVPTRARRRLPVFTICCLLLLCMSLFVCVTDARLLPSTDGASPEWAPRQLNLQSASAAPSLPFAYLSTRSSGTTRHAWSQRTSVTEPLTSRSPSSPEKETAQACNQTLVLATPTDLHKAFPRHITTRLTPIDYVLYSRDSLWPVREPLALTASLITSAPRGHIWCNERLTMPTVQYSYPIKFGNSIACSLSLPSSP